MRRSKPRLDAAQRASVTDLRETILAAWRTNDRVTAFLVEKLPPELLPAAVPPHRR